MGPLRHWDRDTGPDKDRGLSFHSPSCWGGRFTAIAASKVEELLVGVEGWVRLEDGLRVALGVGLGVRLMKAGVQVCPN